MSDSTCAIKCENCHNQSNTFYYLDNLERNHQVLCADCLNAIVNYKQLEKNQVKDLTVALENVFKTIDKAINLIENDFKVSDAVDLLKLELKNYK